MNSAFTLIQEQKLSEVGGTARLYKHNETGAQVLSVVNDDENKVFGVSFRTPSKNATGVAHIMEHSVLCGSQKYPAKDPFVVLLQGSLQSFLNAFTFPDKTCYPVASANLQDFYNLVDVYIDAVFHPIIDEDIFRQEGWHIEAEEPDGPWQYKGVVFNEMKGVYSSPESCLAEASQHALFPDNVYHKDSGGDPAVIPTLTFEQFRKFHDTFYHPSNARFFFWGDDPEEKRLSIVDDAVRGMGKVQVDSAIALQPPFSKPGRATVPYAAEAGAKSLFAVNWLTGDRCDIERTMLLEMLEHILEGMPGSPLRRALISSGLGEDTTGSGLETDLIQTSYSTGLKGIEEKDIAKAEEIIFSTLRELSEKGIAEELVEAAVNTVEFSYREANSGRFPRGLVAMLQALAAWLYDGDPMTALAWEKPLADIKKRLANGEKVFEKAIKDFFLDNPTRTTVVLTPDTELAARKEQEEAKKLADFQAKCTAEERRHICDVCRNLKAKQAAPDTPEVLATIPNLVVADMPLKNSRVPYSVQEKEENTLFSSELDTHGIAYTELLIPLPDLAPRLLPLLNVFMTSLTGFGTAKHDYTALGALISAKTGGLSAGVASTLTKDNKLQLHLCLSGKAVTERIPDLFGIWQEILLEPAADNEVKAQRLKEILLENKARLEQSIIASGHSSAGLRIRAQYTRDAAFAELSEGISFLETIRSILDNWDEAYVQVLNDLETLRQCILQARPSILNCTGSAKDIADTFTQQQKLLACLPKAELKAAFQSVDLAESCQAEAFTTASQVNYVAKGCNLYQLGASYTGAASVILRHMSRSYLWDTVRVLGGAYGGGCSLECRTGNFVCASYRDPNVESTLAAYDNMAAYLEETALSDAELNRAIVGTIGGIDTYLLPNARGRKALVCWLNHETDEYLQEIRDQVLATKAQDFRDFAAVLHEAAEKGHICVIGGSEAGRAAEEHNWRTQSLI